jgi:ribosome maturation factor RimP
MSSTVFHSPPAFVKLAPLCGRKDEEMGCGPFFVCAMGRNKHEWVERVVNGLGYEFVHLEWVPRSGLMRVYIDKSGGVNVDDCARVSDHLSRSMAVEGIAFDRLEVSSPGLDRPLGRQRDFERYKGHKARVVLRVPVNGRKTVTGVIGDCTSGAISLAAENSIVFLIELANVEKARLVPEL